MERELVVKEISDKFAEIQLSFPIVAPRLLMNIELDRDPYHGFESSVLKTMAKYQVPFLLETYLNVGAFVADSMRKCGYRPVVQYRITDGTGKTKDQKAEYFRSFANLVSERIGEGHSSRMAAATFVMTQDQHSELINKVMPILRDLRGTEPSSNTVGVRVMFCTVMENDL